LIGILLALDYVPKQLLSALHQDFGKALARYVIVFNCSDGLDVKSTGRILSGLAQTGAWACMDEFNRIPADVLSVVATQISSVMQVRSCRLDASACKTLCMHNTCDTGPFAQRVLLVLAGCEGKEKPLSFHGKRNQAGAYLRRHNESCLRGQE